MLATKTRVWNQIRQRKRARRHCIGRGRGWLRLTAGVWALGGTYELQRGATGMGVVRGGCVCVRACGARKGRGGGGV